MIVSTTITNSESAAKTLALVHTHVDKCLLIVTGGDTKQITESVRYQVPDDKLITYWDPWVDFSKARNKALTVAKAAGAKWALSVDSDMRYTGLERLRDVCKGDFDVGLVEHASGNYQRELLHRIPNEGRWVGPTHEAFVGNLLSKPVPHVKFDELPKSGEDLQAKFRRDEMILQHYVADHPDDPRWWYYLGDSQQNQRNFRDAIESYQKCADCWGWPEEAAWAHYKMAMCMVELGDVRGALRTCLAGLAHAPRTTELYWYAAVNSFNLGMNDAAIFWSYKVQEAIVNNEKRIGFKHLPAWFEGPYDVLRFAWKNKGEKTFAEKAETIYHNKLQKRLGNK